MHTLTINGQKSIMNTPRPVLAIYRVEWRYHGVLSYHDCRGLDNATDNVRRLSVCSSVSALTLYVRLSGTWVERPLPILS